MRLRHRHRHPFSSGATLERPRVPTAASAAQLAKHYHVCEAHRVLPDGQSTKARMHGIGKSVTNQLSVKSKPRLPYFSFTDAFGVLLQRKHLQCDN